MNLSDAIFSVGSVIFAVSLVPAVWKRAQMPVSSSLPATAVLTAFIYSYIHLHFWYSAATTACTAVCWWLLFLRRDRA